MHHAHITSHITTQASGIQLAPRSLLQWGRWRRGVLIPKCLTNQTSELSLFCSSSNRRCARRRSARAAPHAATAAHASTASHPPATAHGSPRTIAAADDTSDGAGAGAAGSFSMRVPYSGVWSSCTATRFVTKISSCYAWLQFQWPTNPAAFFHLYTEKHSQKNEQYLYLRLHSCFPPPPPAGLSAQYRNEKTRPSIVWVE